ncbi:MAG: hypothetical protein MJ198_10895 [Bacteroidales bacterium]|nr:hypothetical protein [Bacteroidales bacterium]
MKKFLFLLGMLAIGAGMFTSCDDIDDEDNGLVENVTKQKKLLVATKQTQYYLDNKVTEFSFEYDTNGKVIQRYAQESDTIDGTLFNFTVLDSTYAITGTAEFNFDGSIESRTITNKRFYGDRDTITTVTKVIYKYDENGHLISEIEYDAITGEQNSNYSYQWIWKDDNIIKFIEHHGNSTPEWLYEYTNDEISIPIENKTDILFYGYGGNLTCINRYGVAGKNLPVAIINGKSGTRQSIDWTLDKDGYPIKMEVKWADNKDMIVTMDFVWE